MNEILNKVALALDVKLLKIKNPLIVEKAQPIQFVAIRLKETSECIPLTLQYFDRTAGKA